MGPGEQMARQRHSARIEFDLYYIENWSVSLDLKIVWMTIFRGILQRQAITDASTDFVRETANRHYRGCRLHRVTSVEALLDRGCSVVGIDNLLTGHLASIAHLSGRDFVFIKHDVTNYISVDAGGSVVLLGQRAPSLSRAASHAEGRRTGRTGAGPCQGEGARFVIASTSGVRRARASEEETTGATSTR